MASDADSDYLQFKEEFEKKEKEYRTRIHTLKKEVSVVKESLTKQQREAQEDPKAALARDRELLY